MGFLQASNGIDSKSNVLVTGSVFVTSTISGSTVNASGTVSGSNISASGDIVAGDDVFVKNMDTGAIPERIVAISATNGQLFYVPTGSFQIPAHVATSTGITTTASISAVSTPTVREFNGGFFGSIPDDTNPMINIDLSSIDIDWHMEIILYGQGDNPTRTNLQIRTPNTGNGWNAYLTGLYTGTALSVGYQWITNGNGNTLFNTKGAVDRRLDTSSRTLVMVDITNKRIYVHCSNISD
jgi:hypothetical protein